MKITLATGEEGLELVLEADTIEEKLKPVETLNMMNEVIKRAVELELIIDENLAEMLDLAIGDEDEDDEEYE